MSNAQNATFTLSPISASPNALSSSPFRAQEQDMETVETFTDDNGGSPPPDPKNNKLTTDSFH